jgi:hypothetical protein
LFKTYLPFVNKNSNKKGIAIPREYINIRDAEILECSWYYDWGNFCDNESFHMIEYVPMSYSGNMIDTNSSNILLFNEPNNKGQGNLTPQLAVEKYKLFLDKYGIDKLIVGGIMFWGGYTWLKSFLEEIDTAGIAKPKRYHYHGFIEWGLAPENLIAFWQDCQKLTGEKYWITEYNDIEGNLDNIKKLTEFLQNDPYVERYSLFCNRITGKESWYPIFWPENPLFAPIIDGNLSNIGKYYQKVV